MASGRGLAPLPLAAGAPDLVAPGTSVCGWDGLVAPSSGWLDQVAADWAARGGFTDDRRPWVLTVFGLAHQLTHAADTVKHWRRHSIVMRSRAVSALQFRPSDRWSTVTGRHVPLVLDDASVVDGVKADDEQCLGVLYDRHAAAVFGLCVSRTSTLRQAEDALFRTFVQAWHRRHRIRLFRGTARLWLLEMACEVVERPGSVH